MVSILFFVIRVLLAILHYRVELLFILLIREGNALPLQATE